MVRSALLAAAIFVLAGAWAPALAIDAARAWRDLEEIVGFGPRPSGSPALERTRRYIVEELRKAGVKTSVQSFVAQTPLGSVPMANVIGEIPGRKSDTILIGGHYDTKHYPAFRFVGANDGGSSTALLLELARSLAGRSAEYTIRIAFFDGEEERNPESNRAASYGSNFMVSELRRSGQLQRLHAAIVIDMIGDRDLGILRDAGSTGWLTDLLWRSAGRLGHGAHFLNDSVPMEDDHAPFLRAGVPASLLIDYDYSGADGVSFWHSAEDTLDKLSPRSLRIVGEVILDALAAVERESGERSRR
jgi:Zn-dependent M28 family amino/carboxypeptidase